MSALNPLINFTIEELLSVYREATQKKLFVTDKQFEVIPILTSKDGETQKIDKLKQVVLGPFLNSLEKQTLLVDILTKQNSLLAQKTSQFFATHQAKEKSQEIVISHEQFQKWCQQICRRFHWGKGKSPDMPAMNALVSSLRLNGYLTADDACRITAKTKEAEKYLYLFKSLAPIKYNSHLLLAALKYLGYTGPLPESEDSTFCPQTNIGYSRESITEWCEQVLKGSINYHTGRYLDMPTMDDLALSLYLKGYLSNGEVSLITSKVSEIEKYCYLFRGCVPIQDNPALLFEALQEMGYTGPLPEAKASTSSQVVASAVNSPFSQSEYLDDIKKIVSNYCNATIVNIMLPRLIARQILNQNEVSIIENEHLPSKKLDLFSEIISAKDINSLVNLQKIFNQAQYTIASQLNEIIQRLEQGQSCVQPRCSTVREFFSNRKNFTATHIQSILGLCQIYHILTQQNYEKIEAEADLVKRKGLFVEAISGLNKENLYKLQKIFSSHHYEFAEKFKMLIDSLPEG